MLNLSRKMGESIVIGDDIFITILGVKGKQVLLGFNAPKSVIIHRSEIYQKIKYEKQIIVIHPTKKFSSSMQQPINQQY